MHYLFFTPAQYRYISAASNFFAYDLRVQASGWVTTTAIAAAATQLRQRLRPNVENGA
jgi:hypothetical protein